MKATGIFGKLKEILHLEKDVAEQQQELHHEPVEETVQQTAFELPEPEETKEDPPVPEETEKRISERLLEMIPEKLIEVLPEKLTEKLPESHEEEIVYKPVGPITGHALDELSSLLQPRRRISAGYASPVPDKNSVELSLELSSVAYSLNIGPWAAAGWQDISIQVDRELKNGLTSAVSGDEMRSIVHQTRLNRMKALQQQKNPLSQIMSAIRQREKSDTIKAMTMTHPLGNGKYLVAVGFMGTGTRFYDWFSNLRFTPQDSFHKGFLQLCESFENTAGSILLKDTATQLGMERLTLLDIFHELAKPDSRFKLWMSGHSQGGAVMQIMTWKLFTTYHALSGNMIGFGFASPTVCLRSRNRAAADYPLYHIMNRDDLIPKIGARLHLGRCFDCRPNLTIRENYGLSKLPADVEARSTMMPFFLMIRDTPSAMLAYAVSIDCMIEEKGEVWLNGLMDKPWATASIDKVLSSAGNLGSGWVHKLSGMFRQGYRDITGRDIRSEDEEKVRRIVLPIIRGMTMRRMISAMASITIAAHKLFNEQKNTAYTVFTKTMPTGWKLKTWEYGQGGTSHLTEPESKRSKAVRCLQQGVRRTGLSIRKR